MKQQFYLTSEERAVIIAFRKATTTTKHMVKVLLRLEEPEPYIDENKVIMMKAR